MTPTSLFEIQIREPKRSKSGKYTVGGSDGDVTAVRGLALGAHPSDPTSLALAQGTNFLGFMTRRMVVGGLQPIERILGVISATPEGIESPFVDGQEVTVESAEQVEVEGPGHLYSGTGQISEVTAVGEPLSFKDGKLRKTQSGEITYATLMATALTPMTSGNLRIRVKMLA